MPPVRKAAHAGSWYSSAASKLDKELTTWLGAVSSTPELPLDFPIKGCKAVIAPHAGYSYSGPSAGWAYRCADVEAVERVFILGPSHHVYLTGCALSRCTEYATPLGSLSLDLEAISELEKTGKFEKMSQETDEEEHSIEMHLPYLRKLFASKPITIVPILVGSLSLSSEKSYGSLLAPYLASPSTLFVISSDFCHWGARFSYTYYQPSPSPSHPLPPGRTLSRTNSSPDPGHPIHKAIEVLDRAGMDTIAFGGGKSAKEAHEAFAKYLKETRNTICGRHPIGVLLGAMARLEEDGWEAESIPGSYMVERLGRRKFLIYGALWMSSCQLIVGSVAVGAAGTNSAKNVLVAFTLLFIAGFASTWGPGAWVLISELYPLKLREKAMSLATASNWFWNWIIAFCVPYITDEGQGNLGSKIAFIWFGTSLIAAIWTYLFVPETRHWSLEQLDEMFESGLKAWKTFVVGRAPNVAN